MIQMHAPNQVQSETRRPKSEILSVREFLGQEALRIPPYQRPYKWTTRHVNDLFSDLRRHACRSAYRLGTIVIHRHKDRYKENLDIVDGQQRTLTLLLILKAMLNRTGDEGWRHRELIGSLESLEGAVTTLAGTFTFDSDVSRENLKRNFDEISAMISRPDFSDDLALFLLTRCEVVVFTLDVVSEAFQLFDSQNARGRDLDPHDLLKAYHLREFGPSHEQGERMTQVIERWEGYESDQLAHFFESYWFRIRNWSRGRHARYFGKDDAGAFKGVNLLNDIRYPNTRLLRIAHYFTDHHQAQYERQIDEVAHPFPFQIDQTILNGRRFFEMTSHYLGMAAQFTSDPHLGEQDKRNRFPREALDGHAKEIMDVIDGYPGSHRRGDQYVRNLFDCLLLFYVDRFGIEQVSRAIEKAFVWAYRLRLEYQRIQLATVDNHALAEPMPFQVLRDATRPEEFFGIPVLPLQSVNMRIEKIESLFRKMKYLR